MESIKELLPESWKADNGRACLAFYRVVRAPLDRFGSQPFIFDIGQVRGILAWATLKLPRTDSDVTFIEPREVRFSVKHSGDTPPVEGRFAILAARVTVENPEASARAQIEAARGLLCAYHGRNVAYDERAQVIVDLSTPRLTFSTPSVENPFVLPIPRLGSADRIKFGAVIDRLNTMEPVDRDRLALSFRWFSSAVGVSGPDAFLRYWIALEALAMPDSTNIRPISEYLAQSYCLTFEQAVQEFFVGRLFGFRGDIVHGGSRRPVPGDVLSYIAAVYADVLLQVLSLPREGRARSEFSASREHLVRFFGLKIGV